MVAQTKSCTKQTLKISSFAHEYFFCNISTHQNDGAQIRVPEKLKVFWVVRHVLEVIARLPPLRATFFSRSSCGWAGVSLNVAEILIFNCQVSDRGMKNYTSIYIKSLLTSIFISIFLIFWKIQCQCSQPHQGEVRQYQTHQSKILHSQEDSLLLRHCGD